MNKPCKVQCPACPFRHTALPSYLGDYTPQTVLENLWRNFPFFCHTKIDYRKPDWEEKAAKNAKLCLGGLTMANKFLAPKRVDAYPESSPDVIAARASVEGRTDIDCMEVREFMAWHDPANSSANIKLMPAMLAKYPRKLA